jgi:conjugal transfer pilus assembly protein TraF
VVTGIKHISVFLCLVLTFSVQAEKDYYDDRERGYFWYEVEPERSEVDELKKEEHQSGVSMLSPREILKKQGEDWEDSLATAMLKPTDKAAMEEYLKKTFAINAQAATFSANFKKMIWTNPEFDSTLQRPVTTQAITAKSQARFKGNESSLEEIAQEKGLVFFFRSDCPYCHRFAPILKKFTDRFGFTVIPVSLDNKGLPDFPYPKPNIELGKKLNVSVVPALFLIEPDSNTVATVGYGFNDWQTLTNKVLFAEQQMIGGSPMFAQGE